MYGGMNRNELHGLLVLIIVIALGIGAHSFRHHRQGGDMWIDMTPSTPPADVAITAPNPALSLLPAPQNQSQPNNISGAASAQAGVSSAAKIDINRATQSDFESLPMIGAKKAQAILEYRTRMGQFRSVEELRLAANLGDTAWQQVEPAVAVSTASSNSATASLPLTAAAPPPISTDLLARSTQASIPAAAPFAHLQSQPSVASPPALPQSSITAGTVNINTASAQELDSVLWNIGPKTAEKIIQWRNGHGPFRSPGDLLQVPGIGPKTLQKNLHKIRVSN